MSIVSFIKSVCTQDAIYWEFEGVDRHGQSTFANPIDMKCRWDEKTEVIISFAGKEFVADAELLIVNDVKEESMIMLGEVADLPADTSPNNQDDAFIIKRAHRFPLFKGTEFVVFQAFLGRR